MHVFFVPAEECFGEKTVNESVFKSDDEWLYMCEADAAEGLCVHRCQHNAERTTNRAMRRKVTKGRRSHWKRKKKDKLVSVRSFGGQLRGSSSPPRPLPGPSQKPPGVPWFLRKNISAPITPEPGAGLFTLAWPPDSFTDVTYRHTGTLSQRGSRNTRREEEEESGIDEEWRSEADE